MPRSDAEADQARAQVCRPESDHRDDERVVAPLTSESAAEPRQARAGVGEDRLGLDRSKLPRTARRLGLHDGPRSH